MNPDILTAFIAEQHHPNLYCHVLIDPSGMPKNSIDLLLRSLRQQLGEDALTRLFRADLPHAPHLHPILACLSAPGGQPSQVLLKWTAQIGLQDIKRPKRRVCGWLMSEAALQAMASHLTSMCQIQIPQDAVRFYPLFEPIRFELFASVFEQINGGPWGPIRQWLFITSDGSPVSLKVQPEPQDSIPARAASLQDEVELIEALLMTWRALLMRPSAKPLQPMPLLAAVDAFEHIHQARQMGLTSPDDIFAFTLHHLCLHPRLHTSSVVRDMIDNAVPEPGFLAQSLAKYGDADWRYLLSTLTPPEALI